MLKIIDEMFYERISEKPDALSKTEIEILEIQRDKNRSELYSMEDDRKARKKYIHLLFGFVCIYISVVLYFYYVYQFSLAPYSVKSISDKPIMTLLSSTTANVIALLIIVMKYLFPHSRRQWN